MTRVSHIVYFTCVQLIKMAAWRKKKKTLEPIRLISTVVHWKLQFIWRSFYTIEVALWVKNITGFFFLLYLHCVMQCIYTCIRIYTSFCVCTTYTTIGHNLQMHIETEYKLKMLLMNVQIKPEKYLHHIISNVNRQCGLGSIPGVGTCALWSPHRTDGFGLDIPVSAHSIVVK